MNIHIYAPQPVATANMFDFNCPGPTRDGRRCGSRRAFMSFYEWHGWMVICWWCGSSWQDGEPMTRQQPAHEEASA